ncbi:MAG: DNA repair protein RecO [Xanthomonadales bacterium]|nr:DNA repair protein RecO [Xanthomonadales bacterium]
MASQGSSRPNNRVGQASLEPSFVLHGRAYRESSLLLEIFSREHGRVGLIARGARGAKSRWRNVLQPFRPLLLSWRLRGELGSLVEAEQVAALPLNVGDAWFCGLYVNELLMRALHRGDPHQDLFDAYRMLLQQLASQETPQALLRNFEKQLLEAVGLAMILAVEPATGEQVQAGRWYRYHPEAGAVWQRQSGGLDPPAGHKLVSGSALLALESGDIEDQHLQELKRLMRRVLRFHLGDKPLVSQSLFQ